MVSVFTPLPYEVAVKGRKYRLTPAFDNVLKMYKAIDGLDEWDKPEVMLYYLLRHPPKPSIEVLNAVSKVLFPPSRGGGEKAFDFVEDSPLIYAAFMQAYHIDLFHEQGKLHWWKFSALLSSLPSNTRFSEILTIRTKPIPAPTKFNKEERDELMRLKRLYAVKLTSKEREDQLQKSLRSVVNYLASAAKGN